MSTSMIQAYLAMRGPGANVDDPLLSWMRKQDEGNLEGGKLGYVVLLCLHAGKIDQILKCQMLSMIAEINTSIYEQQEWNVNGPSSFDEDNRQAKFHYTRPKIVHLQAPASLATDSLEEAPSCQSDGWKHYAASDISDEEGDPSDGRISPCTFARWAEGAQRWDSAEDKYRSQCELRRTFEISVSGSFNIQEYHETLLVGAVNNIVDRLCASDRPRQTPSCHAHVSVVTARLYSTS